MVAWEVATTYVYLVGWIRSGRFVPGMWNAPDYSVAAKEAKDDGEKDTEDSRGFEEGHPAVAVKINVNEGNIDFSHTTGTVTLNEVQPGLAE
jgi:hypothetical protein